MTDQDKARDPPRNQSTSASSQPREESTLTRDNQPAGFARFLSGIDRGRVVDEAQAKLAELTEAVHDTRKPGTLTIKLKVAPRKGDDGTVEVMASTAVTLPQPDHNAVFFVAGGYQLTRDDPTMEPLFGRSEVSEEGK